MFQIPRLGAVVTAAAIMGLGVPGVVSAGTPVAQAAVSTTACPFHLGALGSNGATGTLFFEVTLIPNNPGRHCVAQVATHVAITPTQAGVAAYTDIDHNPLSFTSNYAFAPGQPDPVDIVGWGNFHCAEPAVPGVLTFTVNGMSETTPVTPNPCNPMGPSFLAAEVVDRVVGLAPTVDGKGYTTADEFGNITTRGDAPALSFVPPAQVDSLFVGVQGVPVGHGVWLVRADGAVFALGGAGFHGSAAAVALAQPMVGMAPTPDGKGYWLVASDGGVFSYGDAHFYGSTGGIHLAQPIVGMAATPDGKGYWLVASDGGVFSYGDARFDGSLGSVILDAPIVGMAADPHGGYWLVAADGGIFGFGGAPFFGSGAGFALVAPVTGMAGTPGAKGYWLVGGDGGVFAFGDAKYFGSGATPST